MGFNSAFKGLNELVPLIIWVFYTQLVTLNLELKHTQQETNVVQYISNKMHLYTVYLYLETALHVLGVTSTRSQERINCICSIWYLSHRYCYLPLSWRSCSNSSTIAAGSSNGVTNIRCCRYSCMRS